MPQSVRQMEAVIVKYFPHGSFLAKKYRILNYDLAGPLSCGELYFLNELDLYQVILIQQKYNIDITFWHEHIVLSLT